MRLLFKKQKMRTYGRNYTMKGYPSSLRKKKLATMIRSWTWNHQLYSNSSLSGVIQLQGVSVGSEINLVGHKTNVKIRKYQNR